MEKLIKDYDARPIVTYDIMPKIQHLLAQGWHLRNDGKIAPIVRAKSHDAPWIYTRIHPENNCNFWHAILFQTLDLFPPKCLDCWKVVVRPRTIKELMALYDLQQEKTTRFCKCGVEERINVNAHYGGYFYNRSKAEGLDCLKEVRALVKENIGEGVDVYLKRYCTEFELRFGPSDKVEETLEQGYFIHPDQGIVNVMPRAEQVVWLDIAEKVFDTTFEVVHQPDFVRQHIIKRWYEFAWSRADMTVMEFFGGEPLYTPAVRYEE